MVNNSSEDMLRFVDARMNERFRVELLALWDECEKVFERRGLIFGEKEEEILQALCETTFRASFIMARAYVNAVFEVVAPKLEGAVGEES